MTTINEMIFKTLKTKANKPARYAEQLREIGYEVKNTWTGINGTEFENEYWSVNGLEMSKPDNGPVYITLRGWRDIEKLDNIKRIDFVGYLAKLDERKVKAERMSAHDAIEQTHSYYVRKVRVYIDDQGNEYNYWQRGCTPHIRRRHMHEIRNRNHIIDEYRALKRKAEARGANRWSGDYEDYEIDFAKRMLEDAEKRVERLWKELEEAERAVERRKADIQKEIEKKAQGQDELDAWLKARGVRAA